MKTKEVKTTQKDKNKKQKDKVLEPWRVCGRPAPAWAHLRRDIRVMTAYKNEWVNIEKNGNIHQKQEKE